MKPTDYKAFISTLQSRVPPIDWPEPLKALWYAAKDNWEASHNIAQDLPTGDGSWIHAYLHRLEGDRFNAGYWYRRVGRPFPEISFREELQEITEHILAKDLR